VTPGGPGPAPRISRYGEAAWLVAFDGGLDPVVNERVIALRGWLEALDLPGVVEIVPAAASLAVHVEPAEFDPGGLAAAVTRGDGPGAADGGARRGRVHRIPVCYDPPFAVDLADVAQAATCTPDEVIARHLAPEYRVFMLGFLPGFPYLGLVDERIAVPRRPTPRLAVPAGSVGIAGRQTGVYSLESPGGWQIIGRTPVVLFDPRRPDPARLAAGDSVRFDRIDARVFAETEATGEW
jgi:inhibitor of KinA